MCLCSMIPHGMAFEGHPAAANNSLSWDSLGDSSDHPGPPLPLLGPGSCWVFPVSASAIASSLSSSVIWFCSVVVLLVISFLSQLWVVFSAELDPFEGRLCLSAHLLQVWASLRGLGVELGAVVWFHPQVAREPCIGLPPCEPTGPAIRFTISRQAGGGWVSSALQWVAPCLDPCPMSCQSSDSCDQQNCGLFHPNMDVACAFLHSTSYLPTHLPLGLQLDISNTPSHGSDGSQTDWVFFQLALLRSP